MKFIQNPEELKRITTYPNLLNEKMINEKQMKNICFNNLASSLFINNIVNKKYGIYNMKMKYIKIKIF